MDIEDHRIYKYLLSKHLLSRYRAFNMKKRALYKVKYKRSYDKSIKNDILFMWNPNYAYKSLMKMSRMFHLATKILR